MKISEKINAKGRITIKSYKKGTLDKAKPLMLRLSSLLSDKSGHSKEIKQLRANIHLILQKGLTGQVSQANLIMSAANLGMDLIIQRLNGFLVSPIYDLAINYIAIGTGSTTPTASDTQLTTETTRAVVVYSQDVNYNELILQTFLPDANLANGTYYEAGSFIGGSATPNSGIIFNHALFATPYVKTSGMDSTIEIDIQL